MPDTAARNIVPGFVRKPLGAVAQLGERLNGIQEADGSIPFSSTTFFAFRNPRLPAGDPGPAGQAAFFGAPGTASMGRCFRQAAQVTRFQSGERVPLIGHVLCVRLQGKRKEWTVASSSALLGLSKGAMPFHIG
jgi:hypothetical protein